MKARTILALSTAALVLTGCGGGRTGQTATPSLRGLARFDVDVRTGKVTVSDVQSRAVLTGGAVSFASSDLLASGGDAGQRVIRIRAVNTSG